MRLTSLILLSYKKMPRGWYIIPPPLRVRKGLSIKEITQALSLIVSDCQKWQKSLITKVEHLELICKDGKNHLIYPTQTLVFHFRFTKLSLKFF